MLPQPPHFLCWSRDNSLVWSCSVAQSCPTLCDPMDCSMPGFPILHHLLELAQIHVHWVGDAIQPSRPLSSPSPPAFNLSQHQGLFQWVGSLHQVAKVLELQLQHLPPMNIEGWFPLGLTGFISLLSKGQFVSLLSPCSQESSLTPRFKSVNLRCSVFFMVQLSHPYMTLTV